MDLTRTAAQAGWRRYCERQALRDRAVFTGILTGGDKLAAFACSPYLYVLPSYSEGFSVSVLEALAAGLPVVISEGCNFPEVAESEAGFVVPAADAAVAGAISTLLSDEPLRTRMGANGRRLVEECYTWPEIAETGCQSIPDADRRAAAAGLTHSPRFHRRRSKLARTA